MCKNRISACMLLHLRYHLILYAKRPCSEKLNFDLLTQPTGAKEEGVGREGSVGKIFATMLPCCYMCSSL